MGVCSQIIASQKDLQNMLCECVEVQNVARVGKVQSSATDRRLKECITFHNQIARYIYLIFIQKL